MAAAGETVRWRYGTGRGAARGYHSPVLVVAISTPAGAVRHISTERRKYKCVIFIWVAQNVVKVMTFEEDIKIDRK